MPSGWVMLLLLCALHAAGVSAQEGTQTDEARAVSLAQRALERYSAGDPAGAIPLLQEAREIYPEPLLLYNLARAYEATGDSRAALDAYVQYVTERPNAPDRAAMEAHIASLREQIDERERLRHEHERERSRRQAAEVAEAEASEARVDAERARGWPWALTAGGVAVSGAGLVFGLVARSERDSAARDPIHVTTVSAIERADRFATVANILFVAGGVMAASGVVWLIVKATNRDSNPRVEVAASLSSLRIQARW